MIRSLLISLLLASAAHCAALPTLRGDVQVHASTVKLRDLVTLGTTSQLSSQVLDGDLTAAPQPGTTRIVSQLELRSLLLARGIDPSAFVLPASVKLSRWSRALSDEELRNAVQKFFAEQHIAGVELAGRLQSSMLVDVDHPELKVTSFELDRLEQVARFRLRVTNDAGGNEFWISAPSRFSASVPAKLDRPSSSLYTGSAPGRFVSTANPQLKPRPAILVHTMKTATLAISG